MADMQSNGSVYNAPYQGGIAGAPSYSYAGPVKVEAAGSIGPFKAGDIFLTFRTDANNIDSNQVYALAGSVSGGRIPLTSGTGPSSAASSSKETGWLYRHFLDGTLDDYVSAYSNTSEANLALQRAIWYAEGKWVDAQGRPASLRGTALVLWNAALSHASQDDAVGVVLGTPVSGSSRLPMASAPHLFLSPPKDSQPVVPVPAAIVLGACGLCLVGWAGRRISRG